MTSSIALRNIEPAQQDQYRRLRLEAVRAVPNAYSSGYETEAGAKARKYREGLAGSADNYLLGAWDDDTLAGVVGFVREVDPPRNHIGLVWGLYVRPSYRGRGVGRRLLEAVRDRARALPGMHHLVVTVVSDNQRAADFYRSVGFAPWGTEPAALRVDDVYHDETHLLLAL
jgi:ribosomal protein S18 acetylase RimI-like enzyme